MADLVIRFVRGQRTICKDYICKDVRPEQRRRETRIALTPELNACTLDEIAWLIEFNMIEGV